MKLVSKSEYLNVLKGTKFTGSGKLGLKENAVEMLVCTLKAPHDVTSILKVG